MLFLRTHQITNTKIICLFIIILTLILLRSNFVFDIFCKYYYSNFLFIYYSFIYLYNQIFIYYFYFLPDSLSSPLHFLHKKTRQYCPQSNYTSASKLFLVYNISLNFTFSINQTYHHHGIAYDYYSINEIRQSKTSYQWKIWPLPNQINQTSSITNIEISPFFMSKLTFVDVIYVISDRSFIQRHANLKKAFHRQGISIKSIEWRMKWNHTTCNSNSSHSYVYQRLNLKDKHLGSSIDWFSLT
jgi:hypothetical protein